jgi:hypothetical protein
MEAEANVEAAEAAQAASKRSWRREAVKAVLLSAAMVGALGACWAGARYHKHVRAAVIAWRWASPGSCGFYLGDKLAEMRAPPPARVLAWRLALWRANDPPTRRSAADGLGEAAGPRVLYEIVKRTGPGSPEETALLVLLGHEATHLQFVPNHAARAGFSSITRDDAPPSGGEVRWSPTEPWPRRIARYALHYQFGSYRGAVSPECWIWKSEGALLGGHWELEPFPDMPIEEVERFPGPWRELPSATSPEESTEGDYLEL